MAGANAARPAVGRLLKAGANLGRGDAVNRVAGAAGAARIGADENLRIAPACGVAAVSVDQNGYHLIFVGRRFVEREFDNAVFSAQDACQTTVNF